MKFLETITAWGDDIIIPINRIKHIVIKMKDSETCVIRILCDEGDFEEYFNDIDKANNRYEQLKKILQVCEK